MADLTRRSVLGSLAAPVVARAGRAARPNVVLIITDDQRYDAFSASGYPGILSFLQTPNMDRLTAEGMHFRNAFCTTSLCSPSRASILSGQYVHTHGVNSLMGELKPGCRIFPQLLKEAGYETGLIGKWHLGKESEKPQPAFDYWAAYRGIGRYVDPVLNVNGQATQTKGYTTDLLTEHALQFIQKKRERPFFLQLAHIAPHGPVTPPQHLESLFQDVRIPYPPSAYEEQDDKPSWYRNFHDHDFFHRELHPHAKFEKYVKDYCRTLVSVDQNFGRLLRALDDARLTENTVVVWMSDNGHFLGEHQFYSKMIMYEEATRIPIMVRFPGRTPPGAKCREIVLNVDIGPTILDLAGVPIPKEMEGRSFRPLLEGKKVRDWRKSFLYEYDDGWGLPPLEGVRTLDGWQYARYTDWEQLYYMPEDPYQIRNLATIPKFARKKQELAEELKRLGGGRPLTKGPSAYTRSSEAVHSAHPPDFLQQE